MSWSCMGRSVSEPAGATVGGTPMAGPRSLRWRPLCRSRCSSFLSPAHHDGVPDEEFSREDADLAIAMTAALLRLAPRWDAQDTERDTEEPTL